MKIKAYLAAQVRGEKGEAATNEEIDVNIERGVRVGRAIRALFPELELFIPHEHEAVLRELRTAGRITSNDIINAYCEVVKGMNLLLVYLPAFEGMQRETYAAQENNIPFVTFDELSMGQAEKIQKAIDDIKGE